MPKLIDLTGKRFGRLVVLERVENRVTENGSSTTMWRCRCDCGNIVDVHGGNLRSGHTRSCGCYNIDNIIERNTKHNHSSERLYQVWNSMIGRCYNKKYDKYKNYGHIGIKVCDEWKRDYMAFRKWAYLNGYDENAPFQRCTLDRINPHGDYCPENCRWVDFSVQANNKSTTIYITYNDETHSLLEWSKLLNINRGTLYCRIYIYNWSIERAFNTPVRVRSIKIS